MAGGRPKAPTHPIEAYLHEQNMSVNTVKMYAGVARHIDESGLPPEQWLRDQINRDTKQRTAVVYHGAVVAYYCWKHWVANGTRLDKESEKTYSMSLKSTRGTIEGQDRTAPSDNQYGLFVTKSKELPTETRTILQLLALTGLRISEACGLRHESIVKIDDEKYALQVRGKGNKIRMVALSDDAEELLFNYLEENKPAVPWVFWRPITEEVPEPRQIRTYEVEMTLQKLRESSEGLHGIVPHSFRHLYATTAVKAKVDIVTLQMSLGHKKLSTTARYTHPDNEMFQDAANLVAARLAAYAKKHNDKNKK